MVREVFFLSPSTRMLQVTICALLFYHPPRLWASHIHRIICFWVTFHLQRNLPPTEWGGKIEKLIFMEIYGAESFPGELFDVRCEHEKKLSLRWVWIMNEQAVEINLSGAESFANSLKPRELIALQLIQPWAARSFEPEQSNRLNANQFRLKSNLLFFRETFFVWRRLTFDISTLFFVIEEFLFDYRRDECEICFQFVLQFIKRKRSRLIPSHRSLPLLLPSLKIFSFSCTAFSWRTSSGWLLLVCDKRFQTHFLPSHSTRRRHNRRERMMQI